MEIPNEFGEALRTWRERRSLSQLALSNDAEISQRHLSFLETGRSAPSREMVLQLAETLAIPLRERNHLLQRAGFAPVFGDRANSAEGAASTYEAIGRFLDAQAPFPALAVDRHWNLVLANPSVNALLDGVSSELMRAPFNVLRLTLHPDGLAARIGNFREWRHHLLHRLDRQIELSCDPALGELRQELACYPVPANAAPWNRHSISGADRVAIPLILQTGQARLSFLSATTVLGTSLDISLSELTIETFLPADDQTLQFLFAAKQ